MSPASTRLIVAGWATDQQQHGPFVVGLAGFVVRQVLWTERRGGNAAFGLDAQQDPRGDASFDLIQQPVLIRLKDDLQRGWALQDGGRACLEAVDPLPLKQEKTWTRRAGAMVADHGQFAGQKGGGVGGG